MTKEVGALSRQEREVIKDYAKSFGGFDNGFTLVFENGLVLSTRFGAGNYCDNERTTETVTRHLGNLFSYTAEVGVWDNESDDSHNWVNGWQQAVFGVADPSDDVRGYVTMPEWLQIVDWCRAWDRE